MDGTDQLLGTGTMSFPQRFYNKRQQNAVELVCDVIQRLFPATETICPEIECYLCYGKGPWSFRFRFKGKENSRADYTGSSGTKDSSVNSHKWVGTWETPKVKNNWILSEQTVADSPRIPTGHPSSELLCKEKTWDLPAPVYLSFTASSQTQGSSSLGIRTRCFQCFVLWAPVSVEKAICLNALVNLCVVFETSHLMVLWSINSLRV